MKGFGKGKTWGMKGGGDPNGAWGGAWGGDQIAGLQEAMTAAFLPFEAEDPSTTVDEMVKKTVQRITKQNIKFAKDERASQRGTAVQAKCLIEEYVDAVMGAISGAFYEKEWFTRVELTTPLLISALHTFKTAKIFTRTLGPQIEKHVEEAIFKFHEEERVLKCMWAAVEESGLQEAYKKKASTHLQKSYDEAFLKAPYGTSAGDTPELGILQDFVKGWMSDFVGRAWDVLENGMGEKDEQLLFVTVLFQNLTDPAVACLPSDIVASLEGNIPASPWDYIGRTTEEVFQEVAAQGAAGGGGGPWKKAKKM